MSFVLENFCVKPLETFMMNAADSVTCQTLISVAMFSYYIHVNYLLNVLKWLNVGYEMISEVAECAE